MAEAIEYINPIIQSMIHANQLGQERNKLKQEAQQFKENKEIREHQLAQQLRQIEYEHEHHQEQTKLQGEAQALQAKQARANAILEANKLAVSSGNPQAAQQLLEQVAPGLGGQINFQNAPNAAAEAAGLRAQAESRGAAEGALPSQLSYLGEQFKNQSALQTQRDQESMARLDKQNQNHLQLANINRGSAEKIAQRNNEVQLALGRMHLKGVEIANGLGLGDQSDTMAQYVDSIWSGQSDYNSVPTKVKRTVDSYLAAHNELSSIPKGPAWKKYKENIDSFATLQDVINDARELAINGSRDSKSSLAGANYSVGIGGGGVGFVMPGSDLSNKINSIKSRIDAAVKLLQSDKRVSDADAKRLMEGFFDPQATAKSNSENVDQFAQILQKSVKSTFAGVPRERMLQVLGQRGITDLIPGEEKDKTIRVKRKSDGKTGTLLESEFDPKNYEKL